MEPKNTNSSYNFEKIVDTLIRLGVLSLLLMWCFDILKPFILILVWAIVIAIAIAIAIFPVHAVLARVFRGRKILAGIVLTSFLLSLIIIPSGDSSYIRFMKAFIILGIYADSYVVVTHKIFRKLVGENADNFAEISVLKRLEIVKYLSKLFSFF